MPEQNRVLHAPRAAALLLFMSAVVLVLFATPASADNPPPIPASANSQTTVNFYRAMAGLPGVGEDTTWSDGDTKHSRYMAENEVIGHSEDPANPYYTP